MSTITEPATLGDAIVSEPVWLLGWVAILVGAHFVSIAFAVHRSSGGWRVRWEALAILGSFFVAGAIMDLIYASFGYVRLLGLAHIIGWAPIYGWLLYRRQFIGFASAWGKYVHAYLVIAGISLLVDALDVVRYLVGDDASLFLRWSTAAG